MTGVTRRASAATPSTPAHWREESIGELLRHAAGRWPDRPALQWPTSDGLSVMTWSQVFERASAGAARLRSVANVERPVAIYAPNCEHWYLAMWAAALAGRPLVPINPAFTGTELATILADSQASTVLAVDHHRGRDLRAVAAAEAEHLPTVVETWCLDAALYGGSAGSDPLPNAAPHDVFIIQYTSGTTGTPKGVVLSHRVCVNAAMTMNRALQPLEHEIYCSALPLYHIGALLAHALAMVCIGGTYVMLSSFSAPEFIAVASQTRATMLGGVPTMYQRLLEETLGTPIPLPDVDVMMIGAASIPEPLIARLEQHFDASVSVMYGQTEAPAMTQTRLDDPTWIKASTVGRAAAHRELKIVDPATGAAAELGSIGEICVRTAIRMERYLNRPEATAATIDEQGWLHTGDLGSLDADGVLRINGRMRDMIVRGGENIYAREVEDVIESHAAVAQAVVVGVPDPLWGETVAAAVTPQAGVVVHEHELEQWALERLARFKVPTRWRIGDNLPMTESGKAQKFKIADAFADGTY